MAERIIPTERACTTCGVIKPLNSDHFHKQARGLCGLRSMCRECSNERRAGYRSGETFKRPASDPEGWCTCRACGARKPHNADNFYRSGKTFHRLCKQCFALKGRKWWLENGGTGERVSKRSVKPQATHCTVCMVMKPYDLVHFYSEVRSTHGVGRVCRECKRQQTNEYNRREATAIKRAARRSNRRALTKGEANTVSTEQIEKLIQGQKRKCWWCSVKLKDFHIDHRIPLARGGQHEVSNLVISCPTCNLRRNKSLPWEGPIPRLL